MNIVIAMDSFKGSLDAAAACEAVRDGIIGARPGASVVLKPIADGGEGTAFVILRSVPGKWIPARAMGPLKNMTVEAGYARLENGTAVVEMAAASGLPLLRRDQLNPLKTTTFGTGELIRVAAEAGAKRILLAVGGSATVDGGAGAAMALGWKLLDPQGTSLGLGGGDLVHLAHVVPPDRLDLPAVDVLCDVVNPLTGPDGAARVFGPQKGATPKMVEQLEAGLDHLAEVVQTDLGCDIRSTPGGGAAGGLAAGAIAFMNARLVSGIDTVMDLVGLHHALAGADWVITGEGSFDEQSLRGKVVSGVARAARSASAKMAVLAGVIRLDETRWREHGIESVASLVESGRPVDYCIAHAAELLRDIARQWAGQHMPSP
jgi:glycerate 2-kinase